MRSPSFDAFALVEQLVGARGADVAHQALEVVVVFALNFAARASSSSGFEAGLLTRTSSTGFDDAHARRSGPRPCWRGCGQKNGFCGGGEPVGENLGGGRAPGFNLGLRAAPRNTGLHVAVAHRDSSCLPARAVVDNTSHGGRSAPLRPIWAEERGDSRVVVVHRPPVERVVVTLCALKAHPHEDLRDCFPRSSGYLCSTW